MSDSIIQDLIAEGVCVLYHDYRSGSFRDWSGNTNHGDATGGSLSRAGYLTKDTGGVDVAYAASLALSAGPACTAVSYLRDIYQAGVHPSPRLFDQSTGIIAYITGGTSWVFQVNATASSLTDAGGHHYRCFSTSWSNQAKPLFYGDGNYVGEGSVIVLASAAATKIVIANNTVGGIRPLHNVLGATLFFNRVLTATEHALVYAELRSYDQSWPYKVFARNRGYIEIDPNETGLAVGYKMKPVSGSTVDLGPSGEDGTISGPIGKHLPIGNALQFANPSDVVSSLYDSTPAAFTFCGWFQIEGRGGNNFGRLVSKGATIFDLYIPTSDTSLALAYHNGVGAQSATFTNAYRQFLLMHICLTSSGSEIKLYRDGVLVDTVDDNIALTAVPLLLGNNPAAPRNLSGALAWFKALERVATPAEVASAYQEGARAILFKTDWGARETIANVTDGFISNTPFVRGSGTWRIVTEEIDGMQCKVLECVAAGFIYLPTSIFQVGDTQAAYGTWEWYMSCALRANIPRLYFVGDQATSPLTAGFDGYGLRFGDTNAVGFIKRTNAAATNLMLTVDDYVNAATFYKCRVSRTNADSFSAYINDQPIDTNGGGGSNPVDDSAHTTAKYVVADLDAGDKISLGDLKGDHAFIKFLGAVIYSTDGDFPEAGPVV